jgi:ATP-dependent exoDNAse (exonuclease V) alpha subunit
LQSTVIDSEADLSSEEWRDAVLVTPRHGVRSLWNSEALKKHCRETKHTLFISRSEDEIHGRPLNLGEKLLLATQLQKSSKTILQTHQTLAIGMRVMVTWNVNTELDVANGAKGTITKIVLDPREEAILTTPIVKLHYPPAFVLVKLDRTKMAQLPGLDAGVAPITPLQRQIKISKGENVNRKQLPITGAYAFTDYRAQGQTIERVIVDIASPPTGDLTPFHVYVALSRGRGRQYIKLLRGFDSKHFQQHPSEYLRKEDQRLEQLNEETKKWWEMKRQNDQSCIDPTN